MFPSSKLVVAWLLTLSVVYSSSAPSTNKAYGKTLIKSYNFADQNMTITHLSFNDTHHIYGLCNGTDSEKQCKVILNNNLENTEKSLSCDLAVKTSVDRESGTPVSIAILNNDRAVVISKVGQKMKLVNVNLRDCSTNEAELEVDEDHLVLRVGVVPYDNSYDVFFANFKLCQKRSCRKVFDNEGKVLKDTVAWGSDFVAQNEEFLGIMRSVVRQSPAKGFVMENYKNGDEPYIVAFNNEGKELFTVESMKDESAIAVSTTGNYIGTCLSTWVDAPAPLNVLEKLECKQFDFDGKLLKTELQVNASSLVGNGNKINAFSRLNLPEGFVLFTILCGENNFGGCEGDESYVAYRLDGNGKALKTIEINDFKCHSSMEIIDVPRVFENNAGQKCISLKCYDYRPTRKLSIGVRCFTDDELLL